MGNISKLHWDVMPAAPKKMMAALERWRTLHTKSAGCVLTSAETIRSALSHFGDGQERFAFGHRDGKDCLAILVRAPARGAVLLFLPAQLPLAPILNATEGPFQQQDLQSALAALCPIGLVLRLGSLDPRWGCDIVETRAAQTQDQILTPAIDFPLSLETYMQARSTKFRSDLRRRRKKATTELGEVSFETIRDKKAVQLALNRYGALEASGWKGAAGTAVAMASTQFQFYEDWLGALATEDNARVFELRIGEQVAAMRLAIERNRCLYMLKVSYNESLRAYSPGALMLESLIEWCYQPEVGVRRIEFYGKVSEAHQPWLTETRTMKLATVYRYEWLAVLRGVIKRKTTADSVNGQSSAPTTADI
jgi:Acetyltransferase (GNAT) domain